MHSRVKLVSLCLAASLLAAVAVGCGSPDEPATATPSQVPAAAASETTLDIPVEALPDPLPEPYLFRDEVTIERPPVTETIYVVQPGDTLAGIANRFCITLAEIQRLNNIVDVTTLGIGQELRIPIREGGCGVAAPESADAGDQGAAPQQRPGEIYIVQEGDTLSDIATAFGFSWVDLMEYNDLTEAQAGSLQVGQSLIIPPPPEPTAEPAESAEPESSEPPG